MKIPNQRRKRVAAVFDKLKEKAIPAALHDRIAGWLIADRDRDEKDEQLAEFFADTFDYAEVPSERAYELYDRFCEKMGIEVCVREAAPPVKPKSRLVPLFGQTLMRSAAVVASAVVLVGGSVWMWVFKPHIPAPRQLAAVSVEVPAGERRLTLPDGSIVTVYAGSHIDHTENFGDGRQVEFHGTARFDVAHDEQNPFTVHLKNFDITVLGTSFRVHSHEADDISTVDLYHGLVRIETARESITLNPGHSFAYDRRTGEATVKRTEIDRLEYTDMPGMEFDGADLQEVFDVLQQKYGVVICVEGSLYDDSAGVCVDLSQAQSIDRVMNILSNITGKFDYTISDTTIIVKPRRN